MLKATHQSFRQAFATWFLLVGLLPAVALAQTVRVQFIHASPDPAAGVVDVYLGDALLLDDFAFTAATPYMEIPEGATQVIVKDREGAAELMRESVVFTNGRLYTSILAGLVNPEAFAPNPEGLATQLRWLVSDSARETPLTSGNFAVRMVHAIPDAPRYHWWANIGSGDFNTYPNMSFGIYSSYTGTTPTTAVGTARPVNTESLTFFSVDVDFRPHTNKAWVEVLTGFFGPRTPFAPGPGLTYLWVFADGTVEQVDYTRSTGSIQTVHAAPDMHHADLYLDNVLWKDDVLFLTGTPFEDLFVGYHTVGIAPYTSETYQDVVASFDIEVRAEENYYGVLHGLMQPENYPPNPEGLDTSLDFAFLPNAMAHGMQDDDGEFEMVFFHAIPDAPAISYFGSQGALRARLVNALPYGQLSSEFNGPAGLVVGGEITEHANTTHVYGNIEATLRDEDACFTVATGMLGDVRILFQNANGDMVTSNEPSAEVPEAFVLHGNYPNPFNPTTSVVFDLPASADVTVDVFDVLGRQVLSITERGVPASSQHAITLGAETLPSGLYLYRVTAALPTSNQTLTGTMVLAK